MTPGDRHARLPGMHEHAWDSTLLAVGLEPQLFVDNMLIASVRDATRRWHAPKRYQDGPRFTEDRPWEHRLWIAYYGSTTLKCWYQDQEGDPRKGESPGNRPPANYAQSVRTTRSGRRAARRRSAGCAERSRRPRARPRPRRRGRTSTAPGSTRTRRPDPRARRRDTCVRAASRFRAAASPCTAASARRVRSPETVRTSQCRQACVGRPPARRLRRSSCVRRVARRSASATPDREVSMARIADATNIRAPNTLPASTSSAASAVAVGRTMVTGSP